MARRGPKPRPRSDPVWLGRPSQSRSTASSATSTGRCPDRTDGPQKLEIVTDRSGADALWLIRHDAAHVLAESVLELYPGTKVSIGPPIEDGFYYDFEFPEGVSLSEDELEPIEEKMREHIKADERFVREDVPVGGGARALRSRGAGLQG